MHPDEINLMHPDETRYEEWVERKLWKIQFGETTWVPFLPQPCNLTSKPEIIQPTPELAPDANAGTQVVPRW